MIASGWLVYIGDCMTPRIEVWRSLDQKPDAIVVQRYPLSETQIGMDVADLEHLYPYVRSEREEP